MQEGRNCPGVPGCSLTAGWLAVESECESARAITSAHKTATNCDEPSPAFIESAESRTLKCMRPRINGFHGAAQQEFHFGLWLRQPVKYGQDAARGRHRVTLRL